MIHKNDSADFSTLVDMYSDNPISSCFVVNDGCLMILRNKSAGLAMLLSISQNFGPNFSNKQHRASRMIQKMLSAIKNLEILESVVHIQQTENITYCRHNLSYL